MEMMRLCWEYAQSTPEIHVPNTCGIRPFPDVDARFHQRARETYISQISGIITHENRPIPMQTLDSQASAQDTHQWHHSTSMPAFPHVDAPF